MDGHPPSFPPDERALSPPLEGLLERPASPLLALVAPGDFPRVPVPSEEQLDGRSANIDPSPLFPDLSVDEAAADELRASRERAWIRVRLGAIALPTVVGALEQNLQGRVPNIVQTHEVLDTYFTVGDHSDRAWRKIADMAWAVGTVLGGSRRAVAEVQIQVTDLSAHLDAIPIDARQPEDYKRR